MFDHNRHKHETVDDYAYVVAQSENHRAILCRDGIQWIIQRKRAGISQWRSLHFVTTRAALVTLWPGKDALSRAAIEALPEHARQFDPNAIANSWN